ncbi:MAG: TIGR02996 domain-containing protein [Planctomycetia bacterium]|nr:TIGR02996 domain-containing protein [Planctomycetia bacterium]
MSDQQAWIEAMAQSPADLHLRLVYADWLEEHGDPARAEFIRLQCGDGDDPVAARRADALLQAHRADWEAPFQTIGAEVHYHRGFPYHLKADLQRLVDNAALLSLAPEWQLLPTREDDSEEPQVETFARLAALPCANRIRGLNFAWSWCSPPELAALFTPVVVQAVRDLRFGDDMDKRRLLDSTLQVPGLRLEVLGFGGDSSEGLGDDGCQVIANASQLASLRSLELPNNDVGPAGIAALAASPHLRDLTTLDLEGGSNTPNQIGPEGARHLARSSNFCRLEHLNLVFNSIEDEGLAALAESSQLAALRSLNVPGNGITDRGLIALARGAGLPSLTWLNVCGMLSDGISTAGVRVLADSPRMARLTGLKLAGNRLGDAGALILAESPAARNLRELLVARCGIGREGYTRLLESPHLAGVREFSLLGDNMTPDEVQELKSRFGDRVK